MSQQKFSLRVGADRIVGLLDRPLAKHWTPVFLYLHGQTSTKEEFFAQTLARQFVRQGIAVCRIDLPGHGESSGDISDYTYTGSLRAVEATVAWLHRRGFRRIAVGGHSLGGALSYLYASQTSGLRAIISLNGVIDPWHIHRRLYSPQALKNISRRGYADRIDHSGNPFRQNKVFFNDLRHYRKFSSIAKYIHCPTLILQGVEDKTVKLKEVNKFYQKLTGVGDEIKALIPLRGVDHYFRTPAARNDVIHVMSQWLARYLMPEETPVVDIFVYNDKKLLLVKRSQRVGAHQGTWHVPAGFLPPNVNILEHAREELREEIGLTRRDILSMHHGTVVKRVDEKVQRVWVIHAVIVQSRTKKIHLNWEHDAARWVSPEALSKYALIPGVRNLIAKNTSQ